jgi:hypothetical protein
MSDSYQAIYDAVRSRISNGDIGNAVENVARGLNIGHYFEMSMRSVQQAASEYERPCAVFRPALSRDGDKWCALYGLNLEEGVAGFGDTPSKAMWDFDVQWHNQWLAKNETPHTEKKDGQ